jgi:ubiquinone/menaquinone biosynthesis C-methylase UbiE
MKVRRKPEWWLPENEGGFFGIHYMMGDDSNEGPYRKKHRTLSERTTREVNFLWNYLGLTPETHLLDCPCGYGRHSINLAMMGAKVTGVDINADFLKRAREAMERLGISSSRLQFRQGDMRDTRLETASFEAVINMFTSFGFFDSDADNKQVIREYSRVLKTGGSLLIHLDYNPIKLEKGRWYDENHQRTLKNGARLIVVEDYNSKTKLISGYWKIVSPDPGVPDKKLYYNLRVYSPQDLYEILTNCGFTDIQILGNLEEPTESLNEHSLETVIKATKR